MSWKLHVSLSFSSLASKTWSDYLASYFCTSGRVLFFTADFQLPCACDEKQAGSWTYGQPGGAAWIPLLVLLSQDLPSHYLTTLNLWLNNISTQVMITELNLTSNNKFVVSLCKVCARSYIVINYVHVLAMPFFDRCAYCSPVLRGGWSSLQVQC